MPVGRLQPCHPSAFLVDQDGHGAAIERFPQGGGQAADLVRVLDIAGEQDEAPGARFPEESTLVGGPKGLGPAQP